MLSKLLCPDYRLVAVLVLCTLSAAVRTVAESVQYQLYRMNRIPVHVVSVDLTDSSLQVTPALAYDKVGRSRSFTGFLTEHHPLAQISGGYFCLRDALPIGDIVIDGRLRFDGIVGSALEMRPDNTGTILNIPYLGGHSWSKAEGVLQGGVRLVQDGRFALHPRAQGFRDPGLFRAATRTAVGILRDRRLLLVAVSRPVYLSQLAYIMLGLGCRDAMSLDGGTSTGLAVGSRVILRPGRPLASVLMVVQRPAQAEAPVHAAVLSALLDHHAEMAHSPALLWSVLYRREIQPYISTSVANFGRFGYSTMSRIRGTFPSAGYVPEISGTWPVWAVRG